MPSGMRLRSSAGIFRSQSGLGHDAEHRAAIELLEAGLHRVHSQGAKSAGLDEGKQGHSGKLT